jgi:hypothetical protein
VREVPDGRVGDGLGEAVAEGRGQGIVKEYRVVLGGGVWRCNVGPQAAAHRGPAGVAGDREDSGKDYRGKPSAASRFEGAGSRELRSSA